MDPTPATLATPYPTARTSEPLRVFTAGSYGPDDNWTREDLAKVVENWNQFQKPRDPNWAEPPVIFADPKAVDGIAGAPDVGIGHEADQAYLKWLLGRTDLPSAGWPTDLWLDGDALYATLDGVPEEVAALVNARLLKYCSAEFYRDYQDIHGNSYGPALRKICLIGGEPPRSKGNGPVPQMIYTEPPAPGASSRLPFISCFTEGQVMDRAAMLAALKECGYDTSKITDVVPDEAIAEMVRASQALKAGSAAPTAMTEGNPNPNNPNPNPTAMTEPAPASGQPSPIAGSNPGDPNKPAMFTERQVEALIQRATAPLSAQIGTLNSQLAGMNRQVSQVSGTLASRDKAAERASITTFCERLLSEKRIEPAEMDPRVGPTLVDRILALDNGTVATFGEKQKTARQAYMDQLAAKPPIRQFSERMADPLSPPRMDDARRRELLGSSRLGQAALRREAAKK